MSKPLVFMMQIAALGCLLAGAMKTPMDGDLLIAGVALAIIAGVGIRKRMKTG